MEIVMDNSDSEGRQVFELKISEDDDQVAYLRLPTHPGSETCRMSKSLRLLDVIGAYKGPDIVLDFDEREVLVGIEIF
jgi:hypothetical protein